MRTSLDAVVTLAAVVEKDAEVERDAADEENAETRTVVAVASQDAVEVEMGKVLN